MTMRTNSMSNERDEKLKEAFALFDRFGGGMISIHDLAHVMRSIGYPTPTPQLERMIKEADQDGNGMIDFDEFKIMMMKHKIHSQSDLFNDELMSEAFRIFDKDGNGLISKMEIHSVMKNLGEQLTDDELNAMIHEADLDGNHQVDYAEFSALVRRLLELENLSTVTSKAMKRTDAYEGRGIIPYIDDDFDDEIIVPIKTPSTIG